MNIDENMYMAGLLPQQVNFHNISSILQYRDHPTAFRLIAGFVVRLTVGYFPSIAAVMIRLEMSQRDKL